MLTLETRILHKRMLYIFCEDQIKSNLKARLVGKLENSFSLFIFACFGTIVNLNIV